MTGAEIAVALIAITGGALVKAISGLGLPIVAIPVMALFMPLEDAVVIMAIPSLISNLAMAARARSARPQTVDLPILAVTGLVAAIAGSALLIWLPEEPLLITLALTVFAYVALALTNADFRVGDAARSWLSPTVGVAAGLMHGATGISGPIYGTYVHALRLPQEAYILSVTSLFAIAGIGQLAVLSATGKFTMRLLLVGVAAVIPVIAVIPFGGRVRDRMSGERFDRLVLIVLTAAASTIVVRLAF
jgi:uncharacterized membrane protein YfcA